MNKNRLFLGAIALGLSANTFAQPEKFVVIEEKTGTWCGFCPSGTVAMATLEETEPNFIGIAVHNADPMANSYYDTQTNALPSFGGYPYSCADRVVGAHAASSATSLNARKSLTPVASIAVGGYIVGDQLEIRILAEFAEQVTGDWRLAAVVVEDNVTGSTSGYSQRNYFAGGGYGSLSGAGHVWHTSPDPVPFSDMEYDHVGRKVADDAYNGVDASLPATMNVGTEYWYSYYVDIDPSWDLSNVHVVAMLIEPDGAINNAGKSGAVGFSGIEENAAPSFALSAYPNPASNVMNLSLELNEASVVTIEIVNLLGEVVSVIETQSLNAGVHFNEISVADLTDGVYMVKATVNDKVEITKVVVSK